MFTNFVGPRLSNFRQKNSIFQKLPKFCRNLSFDEWNKEFTQKIVS